jgi:hypothetical protein
VVQKTSIIKDRANITFIEKQKGVWGRTPAHTGKTAENVQPRLKTTKEGTNMWTPCKTSIPGHP